MTERELFTAALRLQIPEQRAEFLDRECAGNQILRERVESLLQEHALLGSFLESIPPSPEVVSPAPRPSAIQGDHSSSLDHKPNLGSTLTFDDQNLGHETMSGAHSAVLGSVIAGRYTLVEIIGEGGMGSVYLAEQSEPVKRQVALKLIKTDMFSKSVLARFDAERQALALMDHPNIARIFDGGVIPSGQPFFVMELVKGVPLNEYCDARRLSVESRLKLFVSVCQAVQHAHQKGIIHRDLKPGNVLIAEIDGRPTPKVIDFGVAKATEQKLTEMSFSDVGAIVGTPAYMSPEQADPSSMDIDTRTDVYALGVILYELLTGSPPIDTKQFKRGAILEMLRMVRDVDPPKPSTRLSVAEALPNIAAKRNIDPIKLAKLLQGELDWVVMKALEKDRTRRYDTARGLASDIERYLADEIVEARPPNRSYRMKKFVKRNKVQVIAASLVVLALVVGIVGTSMGLALANLQRRTADQAREGEKTERIRAEQLAEKNGNLAIANAKLADAEREAKNKAIQATEETARQLARIRAIMYTNQMAKAVLLIDKQPTQALALLYDVEQCPLDLRDVAWNVAVRQCKRHLVTTTSIAEFGSEEIKTVSPNGTRLVARSVRSDPQSGLSRVTLTFYEMPSGRLLATTSEFTDSIFNQGRMRFSDDGNRMALVVDHDSRYTPEKGLQPSSVLTLYVCDVATGKLTAVKEIKGDLAPPFAISGTLLLFGGPENTAILWDLAAGRQKHVLKGHAGAISVFAFSADGKRVATGSVDNTFKVWEVESGQIQFAKEMTHDNPDPEFQTHKLELDRHSNGGPSPVQGISTLDFSSDGTALAVGNHNWLLEVWDLKKGHLQTTLRGTKAAIESARFYGDGTTILVNGLNRWDIATGQQLLALPIGVRAPMSSLGFADAHRRLVVSSGMRSIDVFDPSAKIEERAKMVVEKLKTPSGVVAFCGKNGQFVAVGCDNRIELWDTHSGSLRQPMTGHKNPIAAIAVSPDGRMLASSSRQLKQNVVVPKPETLPKNDPPVDDVFLWDVEKGELIGVLPSHDLAVPSLAFSPDGKSLATISWQSGIRKQSNTQKSVVVTVWDVTTRQPRLNLEFDASEVLQVGMAKVAFNPVDSTLASAAGNNLRIWDLDTRTFRELPLTTTSGTGFVSSLQYSPDGKTLAVGVEDGRGGGDIGFYDTRSGEPTGRLSGMGTMPLFSPDAATIMTHKRGKIHFWNPLTMQSLGSMDIGTFGFANIVLSPGGRTLGTTTMDPAMGKLAVRLWDMTRPPEVVPLESGRSRFSPDSKTLVVITSGAYQFIDLDTCRVRATVSVSRSATVSDLSPDGRILAVTGGLSLSPQPPLIEIFNTHTGARIREFKPQTTDNLGKYAGIAFSRDGLHLAVASLPLAGATPSPAPHVTVVIWNISDGKQLKTIRVPFAGPDRTSFGVLRLAYSPDGTALLLSSSAGDATVIELGDTPRFVAIELPKEVANVSRSSTLAAIRFTSDGNRIVGRYGTFPGKQPVVMWDRSSGQLVKEAIPNILPNPDNFVQVSPDERYEVRLSPLVGRPSVLIDRRVKPLALESPRLGP